MYLIIGKVHGQIEENNESKALAFDSTGEKKELGCGIVCELTVGFVLSIDEEEVWFFLFRSRFTSRMLSIVFFEIDNWLGLYYDTCPGFFDWEKLSAFRYVLGFVEPLYHRFCLVSMFFIF